MEFGRRSCSYVVTKIIGWIIQILSYVDISCNRAKMYLVIFIFVICVTDSIKGFSRCRRGYWSILLSTVFVVCRLYICMYVRLVMSSYLLFCCIYYDALLYGVSTLMLGVSHAVEVLVLGLLVVY